MIDMNVDHLDLTELARRELYSAALKAYTARLNEQGDGSQSFPLSDEYKEYLRQLQEV